MPGPAYLYTTVTVRFEGQYREIRFEACARHFRSFFLDLMATSALVRRSATGMLSLMNSRLALQTQLVCCMNLLQVFLVTTSWTVAKPWVFPLTVFRTTSTSLRVSSSMEITRRDVFSAPQI